MQSLKKFPENRVNCAWVGTSKFVSRLRIEENRKKVIDYSRAFNSIESVAQRRALKCALHPSIATIMDFPLTRLTMLFHENESIYLKS